ncbi:hypothetical protein K1X76_01130 [bacterium]|nr:hypothetical protein [bacterium]
MLRKSFHLLSPQEVLKLAYSIEIRNAALYDEWSLRVAPLDKILADLFFDMASEEKVHAQKISDLCANLFGHQASLTNINEINQKIEDLSVMEHFFMIHKKDVVHLLDAALDIEKSAVQFYEKAIDLSQDDLWKKTLTPLGRLEEDHVASIIDIKKNYL